MRLSEAGRVYIAQKRANGCVFEGAEGFFTRLQRFLGDTDLQEITTRHVESFLNRRPLASVTWRSKYFFLARFFEFWAAHDEIRELVMPVPKPKVPSTFVVHIYSKAELRALLKTTVPRHREFVLHDRTLRMLLLFLYATGVRLNEALSLARPDVNLARKQISFCGDRLIKGRTIPIGKDLTETLHRFLRWRARFPGDRVFVTNEGEPLKETTVHEFFVRLCEHAGVSWKNGGRRVPWLCHLRNTFAVHRITAWIRSGADINVMLPALAAYMGYRHLESTEQFFFMAPDRFRRQIKKLIPARQVKHWRNDQQLMAFLGSL